MNLARIIPARDGMQASDGPGVVWFEGRPWCAECDTPLNMASTVGPKHTPEGRPLRVPVCPLGCKGKR